jgi:hypothetical protein
MNFAVSKDLSVRKIEDEVFIFNRKDSHIHSFNKSGAFLWDVAEKSSSTVQLVDSLCEKYDVDRLTAEKDALEFLDQLQKLGLIEAL